MLQTNKWKSGMVSKKICSCLCPCCKRLQKNVEKRRISPVYCNEEENFIMSCLDCFDDIQEYWKER